MTDTNGCIANVISRPFPYLRLAFPYKSIAFPTRGAIRSWDEWQPSLFFNLKFFFLLFSYPQFFVSEHFIEDLLKTLWVMDMSKCPLHQLEEQSSEWPDWQAAAEPSEGLLIFPCESWNYLAGPPALSLRICQVWELDSARTRFIILAADRKEFRWKEQSVAEFNYSFI